MDFVTKLPRTSKGHDMIWVIVDRLTKSAHFLATRESTSIGKLVCGRDCLSVWGSVVYCIKPRCPFCFEFREKFVAGIRYSSQFEYGLPSAN